MQEFSDQMPSDIERFPMVPIRDVVIFPYTKVAFKIGRPSSVGTQLGATKLNSRPSKTSKPHPSQAAKSTAHW